MIDVIVKRRGTDLWDGEMTCLPVVGQKLLIDDKAYTVEQVLHRLDREAREPHVVYLTVM